MTKISHGRIKEELRTHVVIDIEDGAKNSSSCQICNFLLRTAEDLVAIKQFNCCDACAQFWARPDTDRWLLGWRPTQEEIEKNILVRTQLLVKL